MKAFSCLLAIIAIFSLAGCASDDDLFNDSGRKLKLETRYHPDLGATYHYRRVSE